MITMTKLPTGYLLVGDYSRGQLETLSIGDYGKERNVKADFLGLTRPINGVPDAPIRPLEEKWVITLSTQYGCPMRCTFCDVPKLKFSGNASFIDLHRQFYRAVAAFPAVRYAERLNIHFARMGEPAFNPAVLRFADWLAGSGRAELLEDHNLRVDTIHPVFTTSLPKSAKGLEQTLRAWCDTKNQLFRGQAGLQLSINNTDDVQRDALFAGMSLSLVEISALAARLPRPLGRKYCLNFAYASDSIVDAGRLRKLFDPADWMVKITPIHNNNACRANGIATIGGYTSFAPYERVERELIDAGFDVLVFIPSMDEERGLVTCGNAVLAGSVYPGA